MPACQEGLCLFLLDTWGHTTFMAWSSKAYHSACLGFKSFPFLLQSGSRQCSQFPGVEGGLVLFWLLVSVAFWGFSIGTALWSFSIIWGESIIRTLTLGKPWALISTSFHRKGKCLYRKCGSGISLTFMDSRFSSDLSYKFPILWNPFKVMFIIFNSAVLVICIIRLMYKTCALLLEEEVINNKKLKTLGQR